MSVTIVLFSTSSFAQSAANRNRQTIDLLDTLKSKANYHSEQHPVEKVYIHFDRPFYILGEDCWFKAYVVGSDLAPTEISSVLYVDWIDSSGKIIKHQRLKIDESGAVGDIALDSAFREGGSFTVRAYTNWMRNEDPSFFYKKSIKIINPSASRIQSPGDYDSKAIDLQFFPVGGTLVEGIETQIAFKAIDAGGLGVDIHGKILNEKNQFVTSFESAHKGMGVLPFTAHANKSYYAILENGKKYPLPAASANGLILSASNRSPDKVVVRIQSKEHSPPIYLLGHSAGALCYAAKVSLDGNTKDVVIPKDSLPEGVLQLTLFDTEGNPRSERSLFISKRARVNLTISSDERQFSPRQAIEVVFKVTDSDGIPIETSLSVSATDGTFVTRDNSRENIYTRLLLQSDIRGNVEDPGWYFESTTPEKLYALDLVMLTHGWSRYNWEKILAQQSFAYTPEKGITVKGQVMDDNRPVANVPFTIASGEKSSAFFNIYETDSLGYFTIEGLEFAGRTEFGWRVMSGRKGKVRNAEIRLDTIPDIPPVVPAYGRRFALGNNNELEADIARLLESGSRNLEKVRILDVVVIKAARQDVFAIGNFKGITPSEIDIKSRISTLQLVSRQVLPSKVNMIIINGFEEFGDVKTRLLSIPIETVEAVVIAGDIHNGYHIAIKTKDVVDEEPLGTIKLSLNGYDFAREFYLPNYPLADSASPSEDNRITLYWNGNLRTDKEGIARIVLYNNDSANKLFVTAEGIANGTPISATALIGKD